MKKILYILPFIASAAFAQETTTDEAYVNPSTACATGDINWSAIEWTDAEGVARTSPITSSTDIYISGPRASNYRHPVVEAGSDISINSLTVAVSNSSRNDLKSFEIKGTADSPVTFTIANALTLSQNFNTVYATNTTFSAGDTKMSYLSKLDFTASNVTLGNVSNGNVATLAFNSTTANLGSIQMGHSSTVSVVNNSDVTTANWYMQNPTLTVSDSKFTIGTGGGLVSSNTLKMNFTNAEVDIDMGIRNSAGPMTLNMENSSLLIRRGAYNDGVSDALFFGAADQKATVSLSNSTISTTKGVSFGTSAESVLTISNLDAAKTVITCSNLTFAGSLIVDFTNSDIDRNTIFTLISATNASSVFDELLVNEMVTVQGLKEGEYYEWISEGSLVQLQFYAIPEPSTYAAVFGILAVAFAFMRRRAGK